MFDSGIYLNISDNFNTVAENEIVKMVSKIGIEIDEDKIISTLEYAGEQYYKGYEDGKRDAVMHGEWILRHVGFGHYWECSVCGKNPCIYVTDDTNFCPNCGANMKEEVSTDEREDDG